MSPSPTLSQKFILAYLNKKKTKKKSKAIEKYCLEI